MLIVKLAWRNLLRHARKTFLLLCLIAAGIAALFVANAIFAGTDDGLQRSLVGSLTGNAVVGAHASTSYGLFGSELPIVSDYESIPPLLRHTLTMQKLMEIPSLQAHTSIVSTAAAARIGRVLQPVPVFGVDPDTYFQVCTDIEILSGSTADLAAGGVFINADLAALYERALKRPLKLGEPVVFTFGTGNSFRLRTAPFAGVHRYVGTTEVLKRVVLVDLVTARSLAGYTLGYSSMAQLPAEQEGDTADFDMDSLFNADTDIAADTAESFNLKNFESELADTSERDALVLTDSGAWSFILLKAKEGQETALIRSVQSVLADLPEARYLSWRTAAGTSATVIFAVQTVFYIGLGFIAFGAVLVIMNSLVLSVLERSAEIGTMRSLGASGGFISRLFVAESLLLTISATLLGLLVGGILIMVVRAEGIPLQNPLLITLFGGARIVPQTGLVSVLLHLALGALVGGVAWIYPVALALRVQPLSAMNKE